MKINWGKFWKVWSLIALLILLVASVRIIIVSGEKAGVFGIFASVIGLSVILGNWKHI